MFIVYKMVRLSTQLPSLFSEELHSLKITIQLILNEENTEKRVLIYISELHYSNCLVMICAVTVK